MPRLPTYQSPHRPQKIISSSRHFFFSLFLLRFFFTQLPRVQSSCCLSHLPLSVGQHFHRIKGAISTQRNLEFATNPCESSKFRYKYDSSRRRIATAPGRDEAAQAARRLCHPGRSVHHERAVAGRCNGEGGHGAASTAGEPACEEANARPAAGSAASSATANAAASSRSAERAVTASATVATVS